MKFCIYPYKDGSVGASALARALNGIVLKNKNSTFLPRKDKIVINWGASTIHSANILKNATLLNHPEDVQDYSNKLKFFNIVPEEFTVPFTDDQEVAARWAFQDGATVVCREILNGHSGNGITLFDANTPFPLPVAPLYTKYVPKSEEFRVHFVLGKIVDVQRKARREAVEEPNWKIRNLNGGFVFVRGGVKELPMYNDLVEFANQVIEDGLPALDFGALDIIYNKRREQFYALEVNTAPGLEGQTVKSYADAFRDYADRLAGQF